MKIITIKFNDAKSTMTIAPKGSHPADCPECNDPIFWA